MIEWTDETWNPVRGCSRVSEGCRHCYAETMAGRIVAMGRGKPTAYDGLVRLTSVTQYRDGVAETVQVPRWTGAVAFDAAKLAEPLRRRKPTRYFVNSMSDLFHYGFTDEQIAAVFGVMAACPQHTFQVLTKRPRRMREWFEWIRLKNGDHADALDALDFLDDTASKALAGIFDVCHLNLNLRCAWPLPNVWIGVSVEDQGAADERIPHLLATPAALWFVSVEPLLGPVTIKRWMRWVSLVIAGCESGPNARPCEVDWLRSLRDQCVAAEVPYFLKQARETPYDDDREDPREVGYPPPGGTPTPTPICVGPGSTRKPGGIIGLPYLDGVQWAQMPVSR